FDLGREDVCLPIGGRIGWQKGKKNCNKSEYKPCSDQGGNGAPCIEKIFQTARGFSRWRLLPKFAHQLFLKGACRARSAIFSVTAARSASRNSSTARARPLWAITWAL